MLMLVGEDVREPISQLLAEHSKAHIGFAIVRESKSSAGGLGLGALFLSACPFNVVVDQFLMSEVFSLGKLPLGG